MFLIDKNSGCIRNIRVSTENYETSYETEGETGPGVKMEY